MQKHKISVLIISELPPWYENLTTYKSRCRTKGIIKKKKKITSFGF